MSLDQFVDVRHVFWHLLDVLGMSVMSCKCQILTKDGHSRFGPKYDFLTSPGRPVDVTNVLGRSDSDQTWTLWTDAPWTSWWHQSPLMSLWRQNLTSTRRKKLFTKLFTIVNKIVHKNCSHCKCDIIFWHHTDQNMTSSERPGDVRLLARKCRSASYTPFIKHLQWRDSRGLPSRSGCVYPYT